MKIPYAHALLIEEPEIQQRSFQGGVAQPILQIVHTSSILMMHRCERLTETMLQAPSSPTSEVRLRSVFCHNLHILNRPRPGRERDF